MALRSLEQNGMAELDLFLNALGGVAQTQGPQVVEEYVLYGP